MFRILLLLLLVSTVSLGQVRTNNSIDRQARNRVDSLKTVITTLAPLSAVVTVSVYTSYTQTVNQLLGSINTSLLQQQQQLNIAIPGYTLTGIRSLTGVSKPVTVYLTDPGVEGFWRLNLANTTGVDNTGTVLVTADGARYERVYSQLYVDFFALSSQLTNSNYNWQLALQKTADWAALTGDRVHAKARYYTYFGSVSFRQGVQVKGAGKGETVLSSGATKGTIFFCKGDSIPNSTTNLYAIDVIGSKVMLSDLTVRGPYSTSLTVGGIRINGVGYLGMPSQAANIENWQLAHVDVQGFRGGTALMMEAGNAGSVTYGDVFDFRQRDNRYGIRGRSLSGYNTLYGNRDRLGNLYTQTTGFLNSNHFNGYYSSGTSDCSIWIESQKDSLQINGQDNYRPANNLTFTNNIIEPRAAVLGHVRVEGVGSQLRMNDLRMEALNQDNPTLGFPSIPSIYLGPGTNGNFIYFDQGSVEVQNLGYNNVIEGKATKFALVREQTGNLYTNSMLAGLVMESDSSWTLPGFKLEIQRTASPSFGWRAAKASDPVSISYTAGVHRADYNGLAVGVPQGYQFRMYQELDRTDYNLTHGKVHAWVKAQNRKDITWTYQDALTPINSSGASFGGGDWEQIGGWFPITDPVKASFYRMALFIQNPTSSTTTVLSLTIAQPSLTMGEQTPIESARPLDDHRALIWGRFGLGTIRGIQPSLAKYQGSVTSELMLPAGNTFELTEAATLSRINYSINRYPAGSIIHLICKATGVSLLDGAFIKLKTPFASTSIGDVITLYSRDGDGVWEERSRSQILSRGVITIDIAGSYTNVSGTNILNLPQVGYDFFVLTNTTAQTVTIGRINDTKRLEAGLLVTVKFSGATIGSVVIASNAYIKLIDGRSFYPNDGDILVLRTVGDGTWEEISRKQYRGLGQTRGTATINASNSTGFINPFLLIPSTVGGNVIRVVHNSGALVSVQNIQYKESRTYPEIGTEITFHIDSLAVSNSLVFKHNPGAIELFNNKDYKPAVGEWIKLRLVRASTWIEVARKLLPASPATFGQLSVTVVGGTNFATATGSLSVSVTGESTFSIDSVGTAGYQIQRINQGQSERFEAGKEITLLFSSNYNKPTLFHNAYLKLRGARPFYPNSGDWITLRTDGIGNWSEVARKSYDNLPQLKGTYSYNLTNPAHYTTNTLKLTNGSGSAIVRVSNTSASVIGFTSIKIAETGGYPDVGSIITLVFDTLSTASNIRVTHTAGAIELLTKGDYFPASGEMLVLQLTGASTYKEIFRTVTPATLGVQSLTVSSSTYQGAGGGTLILPQTGGANYYSLTNTTVRTVTLLNPNNKPPAGSIWILESTSITANLTFVDDDVNTTTGSINLIGTGLNYSPTTGSKLFLVWTGSYWWEMGRIGGGPVQTNALLGSGSPPTVAIATVAAGVGASVSVVQGTFNGNTLTSTALTGLIALTTGTGATAGDLITVTVPNVGNLVISPLLIGANGTRIPVGTKGETPTSYTISTAATPDPSTTFYFRYFHVR